MRGSRTFVAIGLVVIIVLSFGILAVRVNTRVRDVQVRLASVEQLTATDGNLDFAQVKGDLSAVKNDLAAIRSDVGWLLPVAPWFGWLPQVGGDIAETSHVFNMAESLVAAADIAFDVWSPLLDMMSARTGNAAPASAMPITERLIDPLIANRTRFMQAQAYLDSAAAHRSRINIENLSPRMVSLVKRIDRIQPLMNLAVEGGLALPQLLGANGPRTYLIVAQNEDELRATGGFVSAAGRLTLARGKIVELTFSDSYQVDNLDKDFPQAPAPLETYMLAGYWLFRDANWSPDFPTSARQLSSLYTLGQDKTVDGVIAIDQALVRALVQALGPIEIEGTPPSLVTADNLATFMRGAWTPAPGVNTDEWFPTRKNFIGTLASALQAQLLNGKPVNWIALTRALYGAVRERHLLLYVTDPSLAPILARLGWDGSLQATQSDYLSVVDSNIGFNKANALVRQAFSREVVIAPDLSARATLHIKYRLDSEPLQGPCKQRVPDFGASVTYDALMRDCFWDYLRLYVPQGSSLRDASRYPLPAARLLNGKNASGEPERLAPEAGKDVFASFFVVEPGDERAVRFVYDLPQSIVRPVGNGSWKYSLYWQKQAGTPAIPVELSIALPKGATLVRSDSTIGVPVSNQASSEGLRLTFQFKLASDVGIEIVFRR